MRTKNKITHENIESEHICCALANNKGVQTISKKKWLKDRLDEGLVCVKCFIRIHTGGICMCTLDIAA